MGKLYPCTSTVKPSVRQQPETRTVDARFYVLAGDDHPNSALIDGVAYTRDHDQDCTLLYLKARDIEAELLALVPEEHRTAAEQTLLLMLELETERRNVREEQTEQRLIQFMPQHEPMIRACFDPDGYDIPFTEGMRHMHCTLAPVPITSREGSR